MAAGELQGAFEAFHDAIDLSVGGGLPVFGVGFLLVDACLLGLHDVERDAALVVELDEFLLLGDQGAIPPLMLGGVLSGDLDLTLGGRPDPGANRGALAAGQEVAAMGLVEAVLDVGHAQVADAAGALGCDAAEAVVVLVVPAQLAAAVAVAEAVVAALAEQQAGEVVVVLAAAARRADSAGREDLLDPLELVDADDGVVAADALLIAPGDDAGVVVVAQDAVDAGAAVGLGWPHRRRPRGQSGRSDQLGDLADAFACERQVER